MIERYTKPEIGRIWEDQNKYDIWLRIEIHACEAWNKLGRVPDAALKNIQDKAAFTVERINEIEETVNHDVIAFLTNVADYIGDDSAYLHLGLTSSDILDTTISVQLKQSGELILKEVKALKDIIGNLAKEHKHTLMMGRTHNVHAEPISFGQKLLIWYEEMKRNIERLENAIKNISVGQISGAVGNYVHLDPSVEEYVCEQMGLSPAKVTSQIIQRDRHAEFVTTLALISSTYDKIAQEIRNAQRTEVLELEEPFRKGQKGSSAMPHKKNPIICERVSGLSRLIRSNAMSALENNILWHERDISHSSNERVILPDSTIIAYYLTKLLQNVLSGLVVNKDNMMANIKKSYGLYYSQSLLLLLANKGVSREKSYAMVQRNAKKSWDEKKNFEELVLNDGEITGIVSTDEIKNLFDINKFLRQIDYTYKKVNIPE